MEVSIKKLKVDMELGNKGIELDVYDGDVHKGDLVVNKRGLTWCKGRTTTRKGKKIKWSDFIDWADNQ